MKKVDLWIGIAVFSCLVLLMPVPAETATFTVTTLTINGDDSNPGDGVCNILSIPMAICTFKAALSEANALPGADVIQFNVNATGTLADFYSYGITDDLTITGPGANALILDRSGAGNFGFYIRNDSFPGLVVAISGLTIMGMDGGDGAGIHVHDEHTLILSDSVVKENKGQLGGGIYAGPGATLQLTNVSIEDNVASLKGGGIYMDTSTTLSTTLTVTNSSITGNSTIGNGEGGGLYLRDDTTITNTTISGNKTNSHGGGIYQNAGLLSLNNVTITRNVADLDGDGENGGGISSPYDGTVEFRNTILMDNEDGSPASWNFECFGDGFTSLGNNLLYTSWGVDCTITDVTLRSDFTQYPELVLGPLQLKNGITWYHPLLPGTFAGIDAGYNTTCESTDQRGVNRPMDGDESGTATCDIGAYEFDPATDINNDKFPWTIFLPIIINNLQP